MKPAYLIFAIIASSYALIFPSINALAGSIDFVPERDGYGFGNYRNKHAGFNSELGKEDMILIFGAENVCAGGVAQGCNLNTHAEIWLSYATKINAGGHCHGMTVTAAAFWLWGRPHFRMPMFKGNSHLFHFQPNARTTVGLQIENPSLLNFIAYHNAVQWLKEVKDYKEYSSNLSPVQIVTTIDQSLLQMEQMFVLGLHNLNEKQQKIHGHSVLPIAVGRIQTGGGYWMTLYDPNYPKMLKYMRILDDGTWIYDPDPGKPKAPRWRGDATTKTLSLTRISDQALNRFSCPWIEWERQKNFAEANFAYVGEGDLLVTSPNGRRIGYDSGKKVMVNEIPKAQIVSGIYQDDEEAESTNFSPQYFLPLDAGTKKPFELLLSGGALKTKKTGALSITAPGFVAALDNISLDPNENLKMSISPNGRLLEFTASRDGETPKLVITTGDGPDKPSFRFEVGIREMRPGVKLTMNADIPNGKLYFKDDNGEEDIYELKIERIMPDGERDMFATGNIDMVGPDSFQVDLKDWNSETDPCIKDDDNGNGFEDEPCGDEDN